MINLRLQNDALLMKHLHKFYNKMDVPWVQLIWEKYYPDKVPHASREVGSFWWRDVMRLNTIYRGIAKCTVGDGSTVCFWEDLWSDTVLSTEFPRLFTFATNETISVHDIMETASLDDIFFLPLSAQAYDELLILQDHLQTIAYEEEAADSWVLMWGPKYTSSKFYAHVFSPMEAHPIYRMVWKSRCMPRIKFFAWLVLVDHLNTKDMLRRRHLNVQDDTLCVMCAGGIGEDIEHLVFSCPFAQQCWSTINFSWDASIPLQDRFVKEKEIQGLPFFTEATLIAAWELWKLRNDKIFHQRVPTLALWLSNFKKQCYTQSVRFKADLRSSFCFWLDAIS